jgi:glycosyltransferase involved in cell wall biosynthesis
MSIIMRGQLGFMQQHFEVLGVTTPDEKHFPSIGPREGIRTISVQMARTISLVADLKALWRLYSLFRSERPEIVHTHTPKAGLLGMIAAWAARVPVRLHTVGGMPLMEARGMKLRILKFTEKLTYACAHMVYPNSRGLRSYIVEQRFCAPNKLKVLANGGTNGVNISFFAPYQSEEQQKQISALRSDLGISPEDFVFCFIGRIGREKGMQELYEVFDTLSKEYPIKLLLVGLFEESHGGLTEAYKQLFLSHPHIIYPGRADDVRPYYAISQACVFPSWREGFPNALLEAGAMGLPIITTDINGCNEIVEHGVTGLIVPPKSAHALGHAMQHLITDADLYARLKANARPAITDHFGNQVVWDALLAEYQRFIA